MARAARSKNNPSVKTDERSQSYNKGECTRDVDYYPPLVYCGSFINENIVLFTAQPYLVVTLLMKINSIQFHLHCMTTTYIISTHRFNQMWREAEKTHEISEMRHGEGRGKSYTTRKSDRCCRRQIHRSDTMWYWMCHLQNVLCWTCVCASVCSQCVKLTSLSCCLTFLLSLSLRAEWTVWTSTG